MGNKQTQMHSEHTIRKSLKKIPFNAPTEKDLLVLAQQTGQEKHQVSRILNEHLERNPDGKMDRKNFIDLYQSLIHREPDYLDNLSKNVFKALGVQDLDIDQITLNEFLITFVLTCRGDFRKKLEYAFEMYDVNGENVLEVTDVKEIIHGILELYHPTETKNVEEIAKDCFKQLRITEVVKKDDFINGLVSNKNLMTVLSKIE